MWPFRINSEEQCMATKGMATKAKIIATLQYTDQNTHFACTDNLGPCYQQQFLDSQIAKNVAIGPKKMSYVVGYGLRPYFTKLNVNKNAFQWDAYRLLIDHISVSHHIPCMPPPEQPCMPLSNHACPPGATMHAPLEQPHAPQATMHAPQEQPCMPPKSNHACPPEQPCMPPNPPTPLGATTHAPMDRMWTHASENITLPQLRCGW